MEQVEKTTIGFVWQDVDLNDQHQLTELCLLLNNNYAEDKDNMFRFNYSPGYLQW